MSSQVSTPITSASSTAKKRKLGMSAKIKHVSPPPVDSPADSEPGLPPNYLSQKDILLRYRVPRRAGGGQIVRIPTASSWAPTNSGSSGLGDSSDPESFEPIEQYVEICVNTNSHRHNKNNQNGSSNSPGSDGYSDDDDDFFEDGYEENCEQPNNEDSMDCEEDGSDDDGIVEYIARLMDSAKGHEMETPEQRETRLEAKREKMKKYYETESDNQRLSRLEKAREYKRKQKVKLEKVETPEQRTERLRKQRERQRRFYARETEEQRRRRLNKVREYQRKRKEDKLRESYGGKFPGEEKGTVMYLTHEGRLVPMPANYDLANFDDASPDDHHQEQNESNLKNGDEEFPMIKEGLLEVNLEE